MSSACGTKFLGKGRAKWCSDHCRKQTLYSGTCEDCGGPTTGSEGRGPNAPRWCNTCAVPHRADTIRVWTHELIVERFKEWVTLYGEPPASPDWMPATARGRLHDEDRARRFEEADGYWPCGETVHRVFGSWTAATRAAGFNPRAPHGGDGNHLRRRDKVTA
jgi:hypothetical protein